MSACSAERLSAEDYFARVEADAADYDQATDQMLDVYRTATTSGADVATAYGRVEAALEAYLASLEGLEPPAEVETQHDATVAALQRSIAAIPDLVASVANVESALAAGAVVAGSAFAVAEAQADSACADLQAVAGDEGLTVDLHCRLNAGQYFGAAGSMATFYDRETDEIFDLYATVVEEALREFQVRTVDADTSTMAAEAATLREVTIREVTSAFDQVAVALQTFVDRLQTLEPPAAVQNAHDAAVGAMLTSLDAIPDLVAELSGAQALGDISGIISESTFGETQDRLKSSCRDLEAVSVLLGVATDLECSDSGGEDGG
jgi:hypothetical protein